MQFYRGRQFAVWQLAASALLACKVFLYLRFTLGDILFAIGPHISEGTKIPHSSSHATELIRACAASGSEAAWRNLVVCFRKTVGLAIIQVVRNWGAVPQEMVDDLVQETFLKLAADRYVRLYAFAQEHPEAVDLYVKTIAANVARLVLYDLTSTYFEAAVVL